jgi:hypothetical protein
LLSPVVIVLQCKKLKECGRLNRRETMIRDV